MTTPTPLDLAPLDRARSAIDELMAFARQRGTTEECRPRAEVTDRGDRLLASIARLGAAIGRRA